MYNHTNSANPSYGNYYQGQPYGNGHSPQGYAGANPAPQGYSPQNYQGGQPQAPYPGQNPQGYPPNPQQSPQNYAANIPLPPPQQYQVINTDVHETLYLKQYSLDKITYKKSRCAKDQVLRKGMFDLVGTDNL